MLVSDSKRIMTRIYVKSEEVDYEKSEVSGVTATTRNTSLERAIYVVMQTCKNDI